MKNRKVIEIGEDYLLLIDDFSDESKEFNIHYRLFKFVGISCETEPRISDLKGD